MIFVMVFVKICKQVSFLIIMCLLFAPTSSYVVDAENVLRVNGKIAFTSNRDGNNEIYVMNADGSNQTRLTNNSYEDAHPNWSFDGTKIAYTSCPNGDGDIYVMNADGSGKVKLTYNSAWDFHPGWSPDGTKIAFNSNRDGNDEVYVMNADGTGQTRLTYNDDADTLPRWSPDGTKIIFESNRDGNWEIYLMNPNGSEQTKLTSNHDENPCYSPDGTKIVFASSRDGKAELYVMNFDGSGQTRLTYNDGDEGLPYWSPDGTKIVYLSNLDGDYDIYVMNINGSGQIKLTNNNARDYWPVWQSIYPTKFQQTGVGSDFTGNMLNVDGSTYTVGQLPASFQWSPGSTHDFSWLSPLTVSNEKQYVWHSTSSLTTDKSGTFTVTTGNNSITAHYRTQYYLRLQTSSGGSITKSSGWYDSSSTVTISALPYIGHKFSHWTAAGNFSVADATNQNTTLTVNGPGNVTANFAINAFTVTASAGSGGSITPSGSVLMNYGANQNFTITPNTGYHITDVLIDGISVEAKSSYTFTNVVTDHTISASFAINTYTISVSAGSGGNISPSGSIVMDYGTNQIFTITPTTGYRIVDVNVDGASVGAVGFYAFTNIMANHTVTASFALIDTVSPTITNLSPANSGNIMPSSVTISASYSDNVAIDTSSVIMKVDGKVVTSSATVTATGTTYSTNMSFGTHTVELIVKDTSSNVQTAMWSFMVIPLEYIIGIILILIIIIIVLVRRRKQAEADKSSTPS
jgi:hypothetical protein